MDRIKLWAVDLDGTFLQDETRAAPYAAMAVALARWRGIRVCACTGRGLLEAQDILYRHGFDRYCVLNNGATVWDRQSGRPVRKLCFSGAALRAICQALEAQQASIVVQGTGLMHVWEGNMDEPFLSHYARSVQRSARERLRFRFYPTVAALCGGVGEDGAAITAGLNAFEHRRQLMDACAAVCPVEISTSGKQGGYAHMEITCRGGNKGAALAALCAHVGVASEEVVAFGDGYNDLPMLLWAGTGVAMRDADARVQYLADFVSKGCKNAGLWRAVCALGLL